MICRPRQHCSNNHQLAVFRLSSNDLDQSALEGFLRDHLWIVEEELRTCIGLPPWFNAALCFVLAEIACDSAEYKPGNKCVARWIRRNARRVCQDLERKLADRHAKDGFIKFSGCETFEAVVGSVLERKRSLYWEELRSPKRLYSSRWAAGR